MTTIDTETVDAGRQPPQVFLCHAPRDRRAEERVARALTKAGCQLVRGADVLAEDGSAADGSMSARLRQAMADTDVMVVTSIGAAASPWTALEVGAAMSWDKPIFTVVTGDELVPTYLQRSHVVDASHLGRLVDAVRRGADPLAEADRGVLADTYREFGVPLDQLLDDGTSADGLTERFNGRSSTRVQPGQLLRELVRLRAGRRLPRLATAKRAGSRRRSA